MDIKNDGLMRALSSMSGESKKEDGTKYQVGEKDLIDVINSAIQMFQADDIMGSVSKLQMLREYVEDGDYNPEILNECLYGLEHEDDQDQSLPEFTECQLYRFRKMYPVAHSEMCSRCNMTFVNKTAKQMFTQFPKLPRNRIVYRDAKGDSILWENYVDTWRTFGNEHRYAIAYAYDGIDMHLLQFFNNIFAAGIIIPESAFVPMIGLLENGNDAIVEHSSTYGKIDFKCVREYGKYIISVEDKEIMSLTGDMLFAVCENMKSREKIDQDDIDNIDVGLVFGDCEY